MNVSQQKLDLNEYGLLSNTPPPQDTLPYYYLAESNVNIDGVLCNKYVSNVNPSSVVYIPTGNDKSILKKYKWDAYVNSATYQLECGGAALKECYNRADGSIVVKRNAHIQFN